MGVQSINISWSQVSPVAAASNVMQTFSLTISHGSHTETISLNKPYYHFTATEGAPLCEVYNLSVTATYVGATYTGAGCSVPSPVLSRMLPFLPDIHRLKSSLSYSLEKQLLTKRVTLNVSFMVSCVFDVTIGYVHLCSQTYAKHVDYCESYPVTTYQLQIDGPTSNLPIISMSSRNFITVDNLMDNYMYLFSISVSNNVGTVSTNYTKICK